MAFKPVTKDHVQYTVQEARKIYMCEGTAWGRCDTRIEPGNSYVRMTAFPSHEAVESFSAIYLCIACAAGEERGLPDRIQEEVGFRISQMVPGV